MKFQLNNKYVRWGLTAFLVIAASICFYYIVFHGAKLKIAFHAITKILMPILFGFVLAYLLTPILNTIEYKILRPLCRKMKIEETPKRNKIIRGIGIVFTICFTIAIIYALIAMMMSQIVPSVISLVNNFDTYVNNAIAVSNRLMESNPDVGNYIITIVNKYSDDLEKWINQVVFTSSSELIKRVSLSILSVLGLLWNFLIGFVISIYLLASKEKFAGQSKKVVYAIFSKETANTVIRNFRFTHKTFIGFISGKVVDSIIIGLLCFIGTVLLGTPYAILVSVVIGVTNIIPFFGPYLGAVPTSILILLVDPTHPLNCVYFVIFILALQQFDGNILGPKILGDSTGLAGFWVIFAITLFGGMFGVLGMICGVPIFAVIFAGVKSLVNTALGKKSMPTETEAYLTVGSVDEDGAFHEYIPEFQKTAGKTLKKVSNRNENKSEDKK